MGPSPLLLEWLSTTNLPAVVLAAIDSSRYATELVAGVVAVISMLIVMVYLRQLNRRHRRLLDHLRRELDERHRIEDALRASEGFYHSLVESLPASILRKNLDGQFVFGNQKFQAALGVKERSQMVGKTDLDFYPKELAEKYRADDIEVMKNDAVLETVEGHVTHKNETRFVQVIKTPLHDVGGRVIGVQAIFWDVTERKRAEEQLVSQNVRLQEMAESERAAHAALKQAQSQLVQSEKLASLGQIVAGVAHEINNPVAFVTNNVAVLGRDVGEMRDLIALYESADDLITASRPELADQIHDFRDRVDMDYTLRNIHGLLERSRDGLRRIQQIVSHLRLFARLDEGEVNEADLNNGIESTAAIILGHARKKQIRLLMELNPLPPIVCNAAKINQVVMNLLTNAIDASQEGHAVIIRTRPEPDREGILIEVIDEGSGIDPKVRDRIFDPFFTTKAIGQGTGLGLSISYGIVKDHGGTIEVDSKPGQGTRFLIHLPVRPKAKPSKTPSVFQEPSSENEKEEAAVN